MGYNGNNRKLRTSVISKSSMKFGTKLVSNIIAYPIALATSLLFSVLEESKSTRRINYNHNCNTNKLPAKLDDDSKTFLQYIKNIGFQPSKHIVSDILQSKGHSPYIDFFRFFQLFYSLSIHALLPTDI